MKNRNWASESETNLNSLLRQTKKSWTSIHNIISHKHSESDRHESQVVIASRDVPDTKHAFPLHPRRQKRRCETGVSVWGGDTPVDGATQRSPPFAPWGGGWGSHAVPVPGATHALCCGYWLARLPSLRWFLKTHKTGRRKSIHRVQLHTAN